MTTILRVVFLPLVLLFRSPSVDKDSTEPSNPTPDQLAQAFWQSIWDSTNGEKENFFWENDLNQLKSLWLGRAQQDTQALSFLRSFAFVRSDLTFDSMKAIPPQGWYIALSRPLYAAIRRKFSREEAISQFEVTNTLALSDSLSRVYVHLNFWRDDPASSYRDSLTFTRRRRGWEMDLPWGFLKHAAGLQSFR